MFMVTVHKGSWKKLLAMVGCAVILCGVILGVSGVVDGARAMAVAASGNTVKSAEDMAGFLLGYGVEVDVSTAQVLQVTIPKKFDSSFKAFNEVIQSVGMDLGKYKGKVVEKWVLQSPNRTVENQTAYAVLLVKDAKVIGAYLLYQPSGEVVGLRDTLDIATLLPQTDSVATDAAADAAAAETATDATAADDELECAADGEEPTQDVALEEGGEATETTAEQPAPAEETAAEAPGEEIFPTE